MEMTKQGFAVVGSRKGRNRCYRGGMKGVGLETVCVLRNVTVVATELSMNG